ncbi:MAG: type II secretion system F family protein [Acidiferrobacteraceae bacterium]
MHFRARILPFGKAVQAVRLEALGPAEARRRLEQDGSIVLSLRPERLEWHFATRHRFAVPLFTQELVALLEAGVTLGEALEVLTEKEGRPEARQVLERLLEALREGRSFSTALEALGPVFSALYVATVRSAERTGALAPALTRYLTYHQRVDALRKQVINASIYPLLLMGVGTLVIGFLLTYVVPRFATIYRNAGRSPPWTTRLLLAVGEGITHHAGALVAAVAALAVGSLLLSNAGFRLQSKLQSPN